MIQLLHQLRHAFLPALLLAASGALAVPAGPSGLLNDTGQTLCGNASNVLVACDASTTGDLSVMPRQDGRFGRDPAAATSNLAKVGSGAAGFDFSKMCFNGDLQGAGTCTGTLVANNLATAAVSPSTDWACTKDNVTNLVWSLQSGSGDWTTYGQTTLPLATNTASRCGFSSGWRLPTRRELLSIVHRGLTTPPMIDVSNFPGMPTSGSMFYWASEVFAFITTDAWLVDFSTGSTNYFGKASPILVRLVHSGP